jgi:LuxR family maltose regulon positive regulatory protein
MAKAAAAAGCQIILEQLNSANYFLVPLDFERRWFRYHHFFSSLLQQRPRTQQSGILAELYGRLQIAEQAYRRIIADDDVRADGQLP